MLLFFGGQSSRAIWHDFYPIQLLCRTEWGCSSMCYFTKQSPWYPLRKIKNLPATLHFLKRAKPFWWNLSRAKNSILHGCCDILFFKPISKFKVEAFKKEDKTLQLLPSSEGCQENYCLRYIAGDVSLHPSPNSLHDLLLQYYGQTDKWDDSCFWSS